MNRYISGFLIAVIIFGCGRGCFVGCGRDYSNGTRVGVVTKLSCKGLIWKSWEGEMLMALPSAVGGAVEPEKFSFNVSEETVPKIEAAMASGKRVKLVYRQWAVSPVSIDSAYVIVDVKDEEAGK